MEGAEAVSAGSTGAAASIAADGKCARKPAWSKRKRRLTTEGKPARVGGKHYRQPHKKMKPNVSSTHAANNIMKFRLGGSVSDPLNLEGGVALSDECSTCAPSPVPLSNEEVIPPPLMTPHLNKDPLNLEGKVKNFPLPGGASRGRAVTAAGQRRKPRRRTTSGSKTDDNTATRGKPIPKEGRFHYGNYNRYYGYRNNGVSELDPRLALLRKEWLQDRDCLDIGCNTGQVTIQLARDKHPKTVLGVDIDNGLINTAWKNLHRSYTPSLTPDGRPFPASLTLSRGPVDFPPTAAVSGTGQEEERKFPRNVQFIHGNYVPEDDVTAEAQVPEFDVILALSLSKWIHLNWGDVGIKRFFKKVYRHLRPGGKFILEPQPFSSYAKRKKLTAEIFKNYQDIHFRPHQFHGYLLSPEIGFSSHQFLGVPENRSKGFQRPLHMYTKGGVHAMPGADPATSCDAVASTDASTSSGAETVGRLKSVVVVCADMHSN